MSVINWMYRFAKLFNNSVFISWTMECIHCMPKNNQNFNCNKYNFTHHILGFYISLHNLQKLREPQQ